MTGSVSSLDTTMTRLVEDVGDLVAAHREDGQPRRRNFTQYAQDPVRFFREVLQGNPWGRQIEIAEAVRDHEMTLVYSANGVGKDWLAGGLLLWWCYARQGLAIAQAPTDRQTVEVIGGEIRRHFHRADLPGELYQRALRTAHPHAGVLLMTSNEASKLTGFHAPRVLFLLSEAQGLESFAYDAALAVAVGEEDRILAVGNPMKPTGPFYKASRTGSQWHTIQVSALEHPNVVEGRTLIPGAVTRSAVERARREWGTSGQYLARVLGEFPLEAEEGLYRRAWIDAAVARWRERMAQGLTGWTVDAALDVATSGPDKSCLGLLQGRTVLGFTTWGKLDTMETVARTLAVLQAERWPSVPLKDLPDHIGRRTRSITVDVNGVGSGPHDRLKELGHPVKGFNAGGPAPAPHAARFANARAAAFWGLREHLEAGTIDLPPDEDLIEELLAHTFSVTPIGGKILIVAKEDLKGELGRSPDKADTLSMLVAGARGPMFTVSRIQWA